MIKVLQTEGWDQYALLDSGTGMRLERFGTYTIAKPDPQAIWQPTLPTQEWEKADATFGKSNQDRWIKHKKMPEKWVMQYQNLSFYARLTPFKHTGIFPEQSLHWDFIQQSIQKSNRSVKVLNLFAYTGIASLAAASAGAQVTHVDASKPAITWARENQEVSQLSDKSIRWIFDDVMKFLHREVRRGNTYDGIIMDPPVYGHGPTGQRWDFAKDFPQLVSLCSQVLSPRPLFIIVNAYAISSSSLMLENVLMDYLKEKKGELSVGELVLREKTAQRLLSTGIYARWQSQ